MRTLTLALLAASACLSLQSPLKQQENGGKTWVLLVAGSNGWYNYRHQADVAHAFQIVKAHGIPEENIVTMMYDDIANHRSNPFKGQLFNHPDGKDVYGGIKIDYKGDDVSPENFIAVLKGDKTATKGGNGRVIESTSADRVFIYFTDHGAPGLIAFPNDIMTVEQLTTTLKYISDNKKYSELVFYLETCESGSMFEKVLPNNINIYAVTAANADESSWGTYCDNPKNLPCLGDLFSVNWMEDSDKEDLTKETVGEQFVIIKKLTDQSHVMKYGTTTLERDVVGQFQGMTKTGVKSAPVKEYPKVSVPSRDVELYHHQKVLARSNDKEEVVAAAKRITEITTERMEVRRLFKAFVANLFDSEKDTVEVNAARRVFFMQNHKESVNFPSCHHQVVTAFDKTCIDLNQKESALGYVYVLNQMCNTLEGKHEPILSAMAKTCAH